MPDHRPVPGAPAVVLGDLDLVRAVGLAGARCVVVCPLGDPVRFSRHVVTSIEAGDGADDLVERLVAYGSAQPEPPALLVQNDRALRLLSREHGRLATVFRLAHESGELVDAMLDKRRFQTIAAERGLPVPAAIRVPAGESVDLRAVRFPAIVKPTSRDRTWFDLMGWSKVLRVDDSEAWEQLAEQLSAAGIDVLLQEFIPGGEDRIESHHVYIDADGAVAGEFTGRKIRTRPHEFGVSTALVTTDAADVRRAGRDAMERLGLRGVAKLDFKRTPAGDLRLLEVNTRFTLWAHLGARAGVNLPQIVLADLHGLPRPVARAARPGVRWVDLRQDAGTVRDGGGSLWRWALWAARCEAKSGTALDDPMPIVRGKLWPRIRRGPRRARP